MKAFLFFPQRPISYWTCVSISVGELARGVRLQRFDTFDGAKPRFLNRRKKRRSVSTLNIPRASDRGVEWVDFSNELNDNNGRKRTMCKDYVTGNRREAMTTKEKVIHAVEDLPDDATIEDAMQRLLFLAKVERGIQEADAEQTIPHAKVRERMAKWLK